jgi:8-oxo-dGTP pyrophosphatase MutT (NUDIX family)
MTKDSVPLTISLQGVWPDGTVWKYYEGADFTSLKPEAAFGVYTKDNAILLTQNQRGWDIPGGTQEEAETIIATMQRELLEEVGLVVSDYYPVGYLLLSRPHTNGREVCVAGFRVDTNQPLQPITGQECSAAKLCDLQGPEVAGSAKKMLIDYLVRQS